MSANNVEKNNVEKIYLQPTPVRIWHWLNAFCIIILTITGAQIRFPEYVNLFGTYKSAIMLHNTAGIVATCSFLLGCSTTHWSPAPSSSSTCRPKAT